MKLVLAAKSLPLKGINRTMKRLLFPLLAALPLSTVVNAEPIPKISDYELLSTKGKDLSSYVLKKDIKNMGN